MSQNWMRHFELLLTDSNGDGISLSDFKVTFRIEWADTRWPRIANVKIYNLSQTTVNRILRKEFSKIQIIAGYDGIAAAVNASDVGVAKEVNGDAGQTHGRNFGQIFNGDIRFTIQGKDTVTDSWVLIQAIGDHEAFLYASVKQTLAAGYTVADLHNAAMQGFNAYGVTKGVTGDMPTTVFPRGRTIFKPARDVMDDVSAMCNASWQLVDGQAQLVPADKYLQEAIVLNANTGLIGMPQQTMGAGVNVRCLINPNIKINGLVQIDQASVYRAALSNEAIRSPGGVISETSQDGNLYVDGTTQQPSAIAADGVYIVRGIDITGDTRGKSWYMDLMCFARGDKTLLSESGLVRSA